jgi:hypothetical protein
VSTTNSSIVNLDIPDSDLGKICSLLFLFPFQTHLIISAFTVGGNGGIGFSLLNGVATSATSYSNSPPVQHDFGVAKATPGNPYSIATFP